MLQYEASAMINNELIFSVPRLEIISPTTLKPVGTVAALSPELINEAFLAARKAQPSWNALTLAQRISYLEDWSRLIERDQEQLAQLMMDEIAKSHQDCLTEIARSVEYLQTTILAARQLKPLKINPSTHKSGSFRRVAKGVGLAIVPFNYPVNLAITKIVPALVMGNTLVFKPATNGSLTGSYLGALALEAGFPAGVLNVVTGRGREIGSVLTTNPELDFISFTGSVLVGKKLLSTAKTKDMVLELGGKDPALVLDANNLAFVAHEIVRGAFSYSGQRCTAIKRVLTTNEIADQLVPLMKVEVAKLTVGWPQDNADITPVIDLTSANYVQSLLDDALQTGGTLVIGNRRDKNLLWPTLIDRVSLTSRLAWEEPFGPILPIIRVKDVSEMIAVANASQFGLQASVFSTNLAEAIQTADQLEVGTVNINGKSQRGPDSFPFLGIKDSGFGVGGVQEALNAVTRIKGTVINQ